MDATGGLDAVNDGPLTPIRRKNGRTVKRCCYWHATAEYTATVHAARLQSVLGAEEAISAFGSADDTGGDARPVSFNGTSKYVR